MKTSIVAALGCTLWISLFAGCGSLPSLDPFELPQGKAVKARVAAPDSARLGVAVAYPVEEWTKSREDFGHAVRLKVDGSEIREGFADAFKRLGLFEGVVEVGDGTIFEQDSPYIDEARDRGMDLLLVLRPTQNRVSYSGHNGNYVPSLLLWVLFWFPSWWIADEDFTSEMAFTGTLYRVSDGSQMLQESWKSKFEGA
ncbi:MAG: hypothetical protein ACYTFG_17820, partial [Planctomycetota bacterium]